MIEDIKKLMDSYFLWLRDKSVLREIDDWVEITTPYLDRHNDYVQIFAKKDNGKYFLTDDGYTLGDLELSGCKIDTPKRQVLLKMILNGFGVRLDGKALHVLATSDDFPIRKHNLIQAILATNDLFYLAKPLVSSLFYEDVVAWLDDSEVRYTPNVKFTGKSGYDHLVDFVIPKSSRQPERIVKAINSPTRQSASQFAFAWADTKDIRPDNACAYALLNDQGSVPSGVIDALQNYGVKPVLWSHRGEIQSELAA